MHVEHLWELLLYGVIATLTLGILRLSSKPQWQTKFTTSGKTRTIATTPLTSQELQKRLSMENASQVPTTAPEPSLQDGLDAASEQFPDAQPWGRVGGSAYNISPPQGEVGKLGNEI